jgi:hypothetical protein
LTWLQHLRGYWAEQCSWRALEARLSAVPQYLTRLPPGICGRAADERQLPGLPDPTAADIPQESTPAIAAAVQDCTGVRLRDLPITPEAL